VWWVGVVVGLVVLGVLPETRKWGGGKARGKKDQTCLGGGGGNLNNNNNLLTAIGLSSGGSGYFTCIQNMKLVTNLSREGYMRSM